MATLTITVSESHLIFSQLGIKTVELVCIPSTLSLDIGQLITLNDQKRKLVVQIEGLNRYRTFHDAIVNEGIRHIAPSLPSLGTIAELYIKSYGGAKNESSYGILAVIYRPVDQK